MNARSESARLRELAAQYCAPFDNSFRYFAADRNPVFVRGEGRYLIDAEGARYTDLNNGWSSTNFGHAHPRLLGALVRQASLLHQTANRLSDARIELSRNLALASGMPDGKVFLDTTGTSVVEAARKVLAAATGRTKLVSFGGAFHGRSFGALAIYDQRALRVHGVRAQPQYVQVPFPHCSRCPVGRQVEGCDVECLEPLAEATSRTDVAGVIIEPALGQAGYLFPSVKAMRRLQRIVQASGIPLVVDEIQMGLGRAGYMFLHQAYGLKPDIILVGKSIAGGLMPMSALIGRAGLVNHLGPGMHSTTFAGSPLGSGVALTVMRWLRRAGFLAGVQTKGSAFRQALVAALLHEGLSRRVRVEGEGLATVIDFQDECTSAPDPGARARAQHHLFLAGFYALGGGLWGNRLPLLPNLLVSEGWLRGLATRLARVIRAGSS